MKNQKATPPRSWPGEESFDDEDVDDFDDDGTSDLPGIEPRQPRRKRTPKRGNTNKRKGIR